jgi:hypothetical protein
MHHIVQDGTFATERSMSETAAMSDTGPESAASPLPASLLRDMAAAIGVALSDERAEALATQAGPHFALLRALDRIANPASEPAAEFRLDAWRSGMDD